VALDLSRTWVNDSDLQRVGTFTELRTLDLSHTRVTDLGFVHLKKLRNVTAVNLYYAELVGDGACAVMKLWPKLQTLNMRGTKVTDTGVAHLAGHAGLESIDVGFALFTDNGVELLATMPKLRHVAYGGNKMTDVGLSPLKLIPTLRELDLGGLQRTDSGLWQVTITDRGLEVLGTMTELEVLNLRNAKITRCGDRPDFWPAEAEAVERSEHAADGGGGGEAEGRRCRIRASNPGRSGDGAAVGARAGFRLLV
jgi:hypothetical protein